MSAFRPITVVSAGAGTGKTWRLTTAYLEAVQKDGIAPARIIATTFTNKAADELLERVRERLLDEGLVEAAQLALTSLIGTVNSVCGRLVADFAIDTGLSPVADVVPPELARLLFARAAAGAIERHAPGLEPIAERLALQDTWKATVQDIVDRARANDIGADQLAACASRSWAGLRPLLGPPDPEACAGGLDATLARAVREAITALADGNDTTQKSAVVLNALRQIGSPFAGGRPLAWVDWAKLAKLEPAKASAVACEPLVIVASRHPCHPRLHADLEGFITGVFACAAEAMADFAAFKRERGLIDFVDQEALVLAMLRRPALRERIAERYDLLMIDEFQDTSPIQLAVFLELACCVRRSLWVGDQKQAIYGFRGTDPDLVQGVVGRLAAATGGAEEVLDTSRRSRPDLVRFANAVFGAAFPPQGIPAEKVVIANAWRQDLPGQGPALHHWSLTGTNWDAAIGALADGIAGLLAQPERWPVGVKQPAPPAAQSRRLRAQDVAVLCRTNDRCLDVADALAERGIRVGLPRVGLLRAPEALAATAALRYLVDPGDTLAVAELVHLATAAGSTGGWLGVLLTEGMPALKALCPGLAALDGARARLVHLTPSEALEAAMVSAGIDRLVRVWGEGGQRLANLDALRKLAFTYEESCRAERAAASAAGLVGYLINEVERDGECPAVEDEDAVRVLTYHRAKGLEWPVVILLDLDSGPRNTPFGVFTEAPETGFDPRRPLEGRWLRYWPWPYAAQRKDVHLDATAAESPEMRRIAVSEAAELVRLFYVGVTRARDTLIFASRSGGRGKNKGQGQGEAGWLGLLADSRGAPVLTLPAPDAAAVDGSGSGPCGGTPAGSRGGTPAGSRGGTPAGPRGGTPARPWGERRVTVAGEAFTFAVSALAAGGKVAGAAAPDPVAWFAPPPTPGPTTAFPPARLVPSAVDAADAADGGDVVNAADGGDSGDGGDDTAVAPLADPSAVTVLGGRLPLSGRPDMARVGEAVHAFLAADSVTAPAAERLALAQAILGRWGVSQLLPDSLVEAADRLDRFLCERWGPAPRRRETPVCGRIGDQVAEGRIDLLVEGPEGWILIDHKSFPGSPERCLARAMSHAPQLDVYARLIEAATGRKVAERLIHMPVNGVMVRVGGGVGRVVC